MKPNIEELLPFRKPAILIDELSSGGPDRIVTKKLISHSDFFLQGHFADRSVYPGMLLIEGMLQSTQLFHPQGSVPSVLSPFRIRARFLEPVRPGNTVQYELDLNIAEPNGVSVVGKGSIGSKIVAMAQLSWGMGDHHES